MDSVVEIKEKILQFRNERNWEQYHTAKDLAICLSVESSELLELFLWKNETDVDKEKVKSELADVFYSAFLLADKFSFDIKNIIFEKLETNKQKYPVDKAKNSNKKYHEF